MWASMLAVGYETVLVTGAPLAGHQCIVFGAQHAFRLGITLPADAIIYNMEQVGSGWFAPQVVAMYNAHAVWEYSMVNATRYGAIGLHPPTALVPFGYHSILEAFERKPEADRDIDVLHVGSINPRREHVLLQLEARGLKVKRLFGVYGPDRDEKMARCKVLLNVHYYDSAIFEQARVCYAVANRVLVASETSAGNEGRTLATTHEYTGLVDRVAALVADAPARAYLEQLSYDTFRASPMTRALEHACNP